MTVQSNLRKVLMAEEEQQEKRRRGIYLLPNLLTTAALFSGFYAVLAAVNGQHEPAALAIFVAMILDGLDGRVARLTNTQTKFGAEYDSLSDMVAFGLAPALVMYLWALKELGKFGWMAAFIYTAAAALRLARFNTQVGMADKRYFQGLPSPAAAAILAATIWVGVEYEIKRADVGALLGVLTAAVGLLMVSNFRYHSFKELDFRGRVPFFMLVIIMLAFAVSQWDTPLFLFVVFISYAISGPVLTLIYLRQRKKEREKGGRVDSEEE
jgi:CDP-diacylglycerol--serine O-phosphatidyltransferase